MLDSAWRKGNNWITVSSTYCTTQSLLYLHGCTRLSCNHVFNSTMPSSLVQHRSRDYQTITQRVVTCFRHHSQINLKTVPHPSCYYTKVNQVCIHMSETNWSKFTASKSTLDRKELVSTNHSDRH